MAVRVSPDKEKDLQSLNSQPQTWQMMWDFIKSMEKSHQLLQLEVEDLRSRVAELEPSTSADVNSKQSTFSCPATGCNKVFRQVAHLRRHIRGDKSQAHIELTPFLNQTDCSRCKKQFKQPEHYAVHLRRCCPEEYNKYRTRWKSISTSRERSITRTQLEAMDYTVSDNQPSLETLPSSSSSYMSISKTDLQPISHNQLEPAELQLDHNTQSQVFLSSFDSGIVVETAFNTNSTLHFTIPYESLIFLCVQAGNVVGMLELLQTGLASTNDIDPYGLGLLYYATYYCWRGCGMKAALQTISALLAYGADVDWKDELESTPLNTAIDCALMTCVMKKDLTSFDEYLESITHMFSVNAFEALGEYRRTRGFTRLHEILLGIGDKSDTLEEYLFKLSRNGIVQQLIDITDLQGRTALTWAVEYDLIDSVKTLLKYGADAHQRMVFKQVNMPLLHLAIAGPITYWSHANSTFEVLRVLLRAGVDVNTRDHEGWTPLHVAASWKLYDVAYFLACNSESGIDWIATTNKNESCSDLSSDPEFNEKALCIVPLAA